MKSKLKLIATSTFVTTIAILSHMGTQEHSVETGYIETCRHLKYLTVKAEN